MLYHVRYTIIDIFALMYFIWECDIKTIYDAII